MIYLIVIMLIPTSLQGRFLLQSLNYCKNVEQFVMYRCTLTFYPWSWVIMIAIFAGFLWDALYGKWEIDKMCMLKVEVRFNWVTKYFRCTNLFQLHEKAMQNIQIFYSSKCKAFSFAVLVVAVTHSQQTMQSMPIISRTDNSADCIDAAILHRDLSFEKPPS